MIVLVLDTSGAAVLAAVVRLADRADGDGSGGGPQLLAMRMPIAARGHGELLSIGIGECLSEAGLRPADVGAVVAGDGPGPFTSLRVGLVTAAAFAHAVGAPTYGVCSLDAIGGATDPISGRLLVLTDARRREVYWARYAGGVRVAGPEVAAPAGVPHDDLDTLAGGAAELYADHWPGLPVLGSTHPDPVALARLAASRILAGEPSQVLEPRYLRRPDAVVPGAPKSVLTSGSSTTKGESR